MGPDLSSLALCRDEPASFWIQTVEAVKPFLPKNSPNDSFGSWIKAKPEQYIVLYLFLVIKTMNNEL